MTTIPVNADAQHRRHLLGGEPMIFHCHHYNCYLQRTLLDIEDWNARPTLVGAAAEVAYAQLKSLFASLKLSGIDNRKRYAERLYAWAGFGTHDFAPLGEHGGTIRSRASHYAHGWVAKFGTAKEHVCFFDAGWAAGALAAILDVPLGTFAVEQTACMAMGENENEFVLIRGKPNYPVFKSVGTGRLSQHKPEAVPPSNVDYEGIYAAVSGMDLSGNEEGRISAFGVYLTHHYANYYNRVSFESLRAITDMFGEEGYRAASELLTEAGHVCAFNTFGGIMESAEWNALIKPSLKTPEDWVHGIVAVVNAFGWGRWQVTEVGEIASRFVVHDDYESVGYEAMQGKSARPVSFLAAGGASGAQNLVYHGGIMSTPKLDDALYLELFKEPAFVAQHEKSRARGDALSAFKVARAK